MTIEYENPIAMASNLLAMVSNLIPNAVESQTVKLDERPATDVDERTETEN